MDCRALEKRIAVELLRRGEPVWIAADEDVGFDDFMSVIRSVDECSSVDVFCLDMSGFKGLSDFDSLEGLSAISWGRDVIALYESLLAVGPSYLILDDVRFDGLDVNDPREILRGIERVIETVTDYCQALRVIIRSKRKYPELGIEAIELGRLDEAECKLYVELHPQGGNAKQEDIDSGVIHAYTAGYPPRIDRLLERLSYLDMSSVLTGGAGAESNFDADDNVSSEIRDAISSLDEPEGRYARVWVLLQALSAFPYGERLDVVKYFDRTQKLNPSMIEHLLRLSLCEPGEAFEVGLKRGEQDKYIVVKNSVQRYLHQQLGEDQLADLYEKAASVYFGKEWKLGKFKLSPAFRMSEHRLSAIAEQNAANIILKFISDAVYDDLASRKVILDRVAVLHYYIKRLDDVNRYLYVARLCQLTLPLLKDVSDDHLVKDLSFRYARSLRMLAKYDDSIQAFEDLLLQKNDVQNQARIYLNIAYSCQHKADNAAALDAARKVLALKVKGESMYAAKSIEAIVTGGARKTAKLKSLANKARKDQCYVSANNIDLDLVEEIEDDKLRMEGYRRLIAITQKNRDDYNLMRAVVGFCELAIEMGVEITNKEAELLLGAYKYSCGQRMVSIFMSAHEALWGYLENHGDVTSLFMLFRHSSILMRLTNKIQTEELYLRKLVKLLVEGDGIRQISGGDDNSTRYFGQRALSFNLLTSGQVALLSKKGHP